MLDPERTHEPAANTDELSENLLRHMLARARVGIRRYPFSAVGGALALGFVIGSGVPRFVAQTAVSMGLRALIWRALAGRHAEITP